MYETDEIKLKELTRIYEDIVKELNACAEKGIISEYDKGTVITMSKKVLEALTEKYTKVQEGVTKIMGGRILDYEVKQSYNAGKKEAQEQDAYNLFKNGASFELVRASIKGLTDEELQAIYEEAMGNK